MAAALAEYLPGETREARTDHYRTGLRAERYGVYWEGVGDAKGRMHVRIVGQGFASLSAGEALEVLAMLDGWHVIASRLDLARDIAELSLPDARLRVLAGAVRSRAQSIDWREGLRGGNGRTLYIGSPASDRTLRIYDKRGVTRIEVELHRAMAASAVDRILHLGMSFLDVWRSEVSGLVRFPAWPAWAAAVA